MRRKRGSCPFLALAALCSCILGGPRFAFSQTMPTASPQAGAAHMAANACHSSGNVYHDTSWYDGRPALILDYADTSLVYKKYRDEIREVAPGLYLGLMYKRRCPQPKFKMYFALQACP